MKKFRIRESQELLEKYLRMRLDHPRWFTGLDARDPRLDQLITDGYFFALPERDDSGRRVFFSVAGEGRDEGGVRGGVRAVRGGVSAKTVTSNQ